MYEKIKRFFGSFAQGVNYTGMIQMTGGNIGTREAFRIINV